jgi:hypothetical protein
MTDYKRKYNVEERCIIKYIIEHSNEKPIKKKSELRKRINKEYGKNLNENRFNDILKKLLTEPDKESGLTCLRGTEEGIVMNYGKDNKLNDVEKEIMASDCMRKLTSKFVSGCMDCKSDKDFTDNLMNVAKEMEELGPEKLIEAMGDDFRNELKDITEDIKVKKALKDLKKSKK